MRSWEAALSRKSTVCAIALFVILALHLYHDYTNSRPLYWQSSELKGGRLWDAEPIEPEWIWNHTTDAQNLMLTHTHCEQAFHGLFSEIDRMVRHHQGHRHRIQKNDLDRIGGNPGLVRAMIHEQKLYIISSAGPISSKSFTILSQIHKAVVTSPEIVPNIEFAFSVADGQALGPSPQPPQWSVVRSADDFKAWLMPDFGSSSWAGPGMKSFHEVRARAEDVESTLDWQHKQSKLFWTGRTGSMTKMADFLGATADERWADIQATSSADSADRMLDMQEHCSAKYLAHTDGTSYTGRLKYLQLCQSVVISGPLPWVTYHSHLMQKDGTEQNYLEVKQDWSDLESKMRHLQSWDTLGERIARNNVETFRNRFLTPAAEACSWRRLFKGWAEVTDFEPELYEAGEGGNKLERGVLYERFLIDMTFG